MRDLTEIDIKILQYIEKRGKADIASIKKKFPNTSAIEYRLKQLSTPEYHRFANSTVSIPIKNSCCLREHVESVETKNGYSHDTYLGIYELTDFGKRELQDHITEKRLARKELWLKNAWIPIIVAFATTVGTNYILPKLPQILHWVASTLSKIAS